MDNKSVFELSSVRNTRRAFLRSGDRRTSIHIRIEESGQIVAGMRVRSLSCKDLEFTPQCFLVGRSADRELVAVFNKLDHLNPAEFSDCFRWIEEVASQFRAIREGWQQTIGDEAKS